MNLKQFLTLFEAKKKKSVGSQVPMNDPASQSKNMEDIKLKKDKDVGFIKPGSIDRKNNKGSLVNFRQMGKWNYVKGYLMSLAIPYVSHKWESSGDIVVQVDPEYCTKMSFKAGKNGELDKKFYKMIEDAGFKTETIKFVTKPIEGKETTIVVTA